MKTKELVGKEVNHYHLGRVLIISVPKGSRVKLEVECIDRGPGWDDVRQTYTGVRAQFLSDDGLRSKTWHRGENKQYGFKDIINIKELRL